MSRRIYNNREKRSDIFFNRSAAIFRISPHVVVHIYRYRRARGNEFGTFRMSSRRIDGCHPTFREVRWFTPRFLFDSGMVNRFVLTGVSVASRTGCKSISRAHREEFPRAGAVRIFFLFFFLNFLAVELRWRSISRWAPPAFALVKLKFRNFRIDVGSPYPGARQIKLT